MKYDTVIGLEVHIQLNTRSKAFCGDANTFGQEPNNHVSAVSLAHPGTLPVVNVKQILKAIKLGLSLGCRINRVNFFDRKHYFYPDLPKGYQITQDGMPICVGGTLEIDVNGTTKEVRIHHIHMEEDAGKTVHDVDPKYSLVDLNRAGTPLLELVTEPDLSSGEEVFAFINELQKLLRFIDVSDADMEKGSMRCDCNVSIKPAGSVKLGERCEIKNLNSKRFARDAVEYEARRQAKLLDRGQRFTKQTLHYDSVRKVTQVLREKEGAEDYRYFNDPDLPPVIILPETIRKIEEELPALPRHIKLKLIHETGLSEDYAEQLSQTPFVHELFVRLAQKSANVQLAANFVVNQYLPAMPTKGEVNEVAQIPESSLVEFIKMIQSGRIIPSMANQRLWPALITSPHTSPESLADKLGILKRKDQNFLDDLIAEVLNENPAQVDQYRSGKTNLMGFFVGRVMRRAKGTADPVLLKQKLQEALTSS